MQVTFILEIKLQKEHFFRKIWFPLNKHAPIFSPSEDRNMSTYSTTWEMEKKTFSSTEVPISNPF